jgi:hypothetical protein
MKKYVDILFESMVAKDISIIYLGGPICSNRKLHRRQHC